jgi:hypothetical protein
MHHGRSVDMKTKKNRELTVLLVAVIVCGMFAVFPGTSSATVPNLTIQSDIHVTSETAVVTFAIDQQSTVSWVVKPSSESAPDVETIMAAGGPPLYHGVSLSGAFVYGPVMWNLSPSTEYICYMAAQNPDGERTGVVTSSPFTTTAVTTDIKAEPLTGITPPVAGLTPSTAINGGTHFTSTLRWNENPSTFTEGMVYVATITLAAEQGYTFNRMNRPSDISGFTVNGVVPEWGSKDGGGATITFEITFPPAGAPIAPDITGPTSKSIVSGYGRTSTSEFTLTGNPAPTVIKESGNAAIKWNNDTCKLDIAAGLAPGSYPVKLKASNGTSPDVVFTFTVIVKAAPPATVAPTIMGPSAMSLMSGYDPISTDGFTFTGNPASTVTKESGDVAITWNNSTKKLDVAAGLAPGTYPVELKAANGTSPDATFTFTLTVQAVSTPEENEQDTSQTNGGSNTALWATVLLMASVFGVAAIIAWQKWR